MGPLALVAIAAAAKDHDQPAARQRAQCGQHLVQRVRLMGIVHEDGRGATAADQLQPAGRAFKRGQGSQHRLGFVAAGDAKPGGDERVRNLEVAGQRQTRRHRATGDFEVENGGQVVRDDPGEAQAVAATAHREDRETPGLASGDDLIRHIAVGVDHSREAFRQEGLEQAQLGGKIIVERAVIIEMIAREVGEGGGREPHAVEPLLLDPMRRGFEREMGHAIGRQHREAGVEADRIRRGERSVDAGLRRDDPDRPERGGLMAESLPDLAAEGRDRRLAARAGDRDDRAGLCGMEGSGSAGERMSYVIDQDEGDARDRLAGLALGDDGHRAFVDCLPDEARAIVFRAGYREEDEARLHAPAVGREATDFEAAEPGRAGRLRQKRGKPCQWRPSFDVCGVFA